MKGEIDMKYAKYPKPCKADYKFRYKGYKKAYLLIMTEIDYNCRNGEIKHKNKYCSSYYWWF